MIAHDQIARAILQSPADAVIAADRGGIIQFWNPGAERLFGYRAGEALGCSLDIIIPEALQAQAAGAQLLKEVLFP